jgi:hypothetical protein
VVLSPLTRRVAELVGYGGFIPAPSAANMSFAIHPDRVVLGTLPERGVVLTGTVLATRPFGPRYECTVREHSGAQFAIHVDQPPATGAECALTALDPPVVAP